MAVYHVLKDGTRKKDISGHVVKMTECRSLYKLIAEINKRPGKQQKKGSARAC